MNRRKKWEFARRLKRRIVLIKIIDPYTRERLIKQEFVLPTDFQKMIKILNTFK